MRTIPSYLLIILSLYSVLAGNAQQSPVSPRAAQDSAWVESIKHPWSLLTRERQLPSIPDSLPALKKDSTEKKKPLLVFQQGYIQYNLNYRQRIDTPYAENNIYQHTVALNADVLINGSLPITINYFERESNSSLFRDFRDIRVDVNGPQLQQLRAAAIRRQVMGKVKGIEDQVSLPSIKKQQMQLGQWNELLQQPVIVTLLIQCKERLLHLDEQDSSSKWKDSVEWYAGKFIKAYEAKEGEVKQWETRIDSLKTVYKSNMQKVQTLRGLLNRQISTGEGIRQLQESLRKAGLPSTDMPSLSGWQYALRKLSLGRTMPDFSPLTVQHINVKGINAEFSNDIWYAAFTAGAVDFRLRDFAYGNTKQPPQFLYAARMGLGRKEGTHIYATGYKGKKQVYSFNAPSQDITGAGIELQYAWKRDHRVTAEWVQSSPTTDTKSSWGSNDTRAYSLQWHSYFPQLKANAEAYYQKTGFYFQSFNSYRVNAATESWYLKYDQYFFGRQLRLNAAVRKNDYANPLIAQRYATNTVFTTLQATFKKKKWPTIAAGYIPSSQYTVVDNTVYESRYQTLTASIYHTYKMGIANFSTNAFYSRFYNHSSDSGFVYYNANYVSIYQQMQFALHTATLAATVSKGAEFTLTVLQVGAATTIHKTWQVEAGVKINNLNNTIIKTGMYCRTSIQVPWLGQVAGWYDDGYLPGWGRTLTRNQQMNIGFTRRIK